MYYALGCGTVVNVLLCILQIECVWWIVQCMKVLGTLTVVSAMLSASTIVGVFRGKLGSWTNSTAISSNAFTILGITVTTQQWITHTHTNTHTHTHIHTHTLTQQNDFAEPPSATLGLHPPPVLHLMQPSGKEKKKTCYNSWEPTHSLASSWTSWLLQNSLQVNVALLLHQKINLGKWMNVTSSLLLLDQIVNFVLCTCLCRYIGTNIPAASELGNS